MTRQRFEQLVVEALRLIPRHLRQAIKNVAVVVEDEPAGQLLAEMGVEAPDTLFGLYQGTPLTERGWDDGNRLPDRIVIFQGPIEEACGGDEGQVVVAIGETVIHEFGHHFGLSEQEIEAIEESYWRGESDEDE